MIASILRTAHRRPPRLGEARMICIDGHSGAGKTALARELASGRDLLLLEIEQLYEGWHGLAGAPQRLREEVLDPLAAGRPATFTCWDWERERWGRQRTVRPSPLVVVEGVGAGARQVADLASLLVWVEAPVDERKRRALARDGASYAPHWDDWAAQEDALFAVEQPWLRADIVISSAG